MSSLRQYKSGAAKRKAKEEKLKSIQKLPKLTMFFKTPEDIASLQDHEGKETIDDVGLNVGEINELDSQSQENENLRKDSQNELQPKSTSSSSSLWISNDAGLWPTNLTDEFRSRCVEKGSDYFQNDDGVYESSKRCFKTPNRKLSNRLFHKKMINGETVRRKWIMYSPSVGSIYCFVCKLFAVKGVSAFAHQGFSNWGKAEESTLSHENSIEHRDSMFLFLNRTNLSCRIDKSLIDQFNKESEYWIKVFERIVTVIKFIAERGLSFRGHVEKFGDCRNGNFLGILELISEFDPFLKTHIERYGGKGSGHVSYLSKTIYEEFIEIIGGEVKNKIICEIKNAKYYSLIVDSTPDISHTDQLSVIIRYCISNKVHERFLTFLPIFSHTGSSLSTVILEFLDTHGINILNCRGQSYDNASNMSGKYRGLQAEIRNRNNLAFYVPCAAHSLNLVGQCSVEASTEASRYFMFLQKLYAFFANSTHRWDVLTRKLQENKKKFTLKSLSSTRWSCREDATKALEANYDEIYDSLTAIRDDPNEKKETKMESSSLVNTLEKFETAFMTIFWNTVLNQLGAVSNTLQKPGLDLNTGTQLLQGLQTSIKKHRENFECFEEKTKNLSTHVDFQYSKKRSDLKRKFPDGQSLHLEGSTKFKIETFYVSIDTLVSELDKRREAYSDISRLFGFFGDFRNIEEEELRQCARKIVDTYKDDLDIALVEEIY
ncbi:zinc finger MYM-type protein 1-like [Photinus pyralis]|uniref:zinc finger MYM-type protein 1-like n=1 Tax=Photinus pyralis TaxID=7054 RepID=UPI00126720B0|nr:zinc finger MYM-type protein 1-like [Photinus pyralis]